MSLPITDRAGYECFGQPNVHLKSWYFFQDTVEYQPFWACNTGGQASQLAPFYAFANYRWDQLMHIMYGR